MSKTFINDSERERCFCWFWISFYKINVYCVFVVALWIMCLCFRLCAHKQLVQWWQVEGSWRAEYPWLGPRPHRPPSSTDHRCPCLRISDWLWIQSCIGTSTNNANIYRYLRYSRAWGTILSILPRNHQFSFDCCCWTIVHYAILAVFVSWSTICHKQHWKT